MAAKIRVYELARELGLTNKETLDLCDSLGIGASSHSSSVVDAQADRVRRKAEREGLVRNEQPEEPKKAKKTAKKMTAADATGTSAEESDSSSEDSFAAVATAESAAGSGTAEKTTPDNRGDGPKSAPEKKRSLVTSSGTQGSPVGGPPVPKSPPPRAPMPPPPAAPPPAVSQPVPVAKAPEPVVRSEPAPVAPAEVVPAVAPTALAPVESTPVVEATPRAPTPAAEAMPTPAAPTAPAASVPSEIAAVVSTGSAAKPDSVAQTIKADSGAPAPSDQNAGAGTGDEKAKVPAGQADTVAKDAAAEGGRPLSASGKPIPPPPGPPMSHSGKPIPPPPGRGGRGPSPSAGGRPGGAGAGAGAGRPSGGAGAGAGAGAGTGGPLPRTPGGPPRSGGRPGAGGGGGPRTSVPGAGGRPGGPNRGGQRPRPRRKSRRRRNREELQPMDMPAYTPDDAAVPKGTVVIERASTPQELGPKLNRTAADVVRFLMQQGEMVTATQSLNDDMIELFAAEIGAELRLVDPGEEQEVELRKMLEVDAYEDDEPDDDSPHRPPVITVMGHVDHGKTLLLDRIRNANVVAGEAGGITQHIGAYQVNRDGHQMTFIDTPGHEAFTAMRSRGADATDIVVLIVAADDGVMPTTVEALAHARAADVPIVVAINKIDRENADVDRVKQQLAEQQLVPESWGGDTVTVEISALQELGIDDLLDNLLIVSELEDLRSNPDGRARGVVLEANLDVGRGPVATVLVQNGTLKVGDPMVAGAAWGRVRALINDQGEQIKEAGPSSPVQVLGLSDVAEAGDEFVIAPNEKTASKVAETRDHWTRQSSMGRDAHAMSGGARLEDIFQQIQAGEAATLNLILKTDVTGSLEALTDSLKKLERDEVKLSFVHRGVGRITENDIQLAAAANASIIGFNVRPDRKARDLAGQENVEIRTYEIIYQVIDDIEKAMVGMLAPEFEEVVTGDAEVREIFRVPRIGAIAGCYVQSGVITRGSKVRFLREGTIIWKGAVNSLKRFKDDAREVQTGFECGIGLSDFQDLKPGDIIETYEEREIPRS